MAVFFGTSTVTETRKNAIQAAWKKKRVPYLIGEPGTGKSEFVDALSRELTGGYNSVQVIGSQMEPMDVLGLPLLGESNGRPITENAMPWWLDEALTIMNKTGYAVVFLDELNSTQPPTQASFLTVIQSRRVGRYTIPANICLIAAGNPPDQAADGWMLAPPLSNRLFQITYEANVNDWFEGMLVAWNDEEVEEVELQARSIIVSFLRSHTDLIQAFPDTLEEASQPWPSMRSWDSLAGMLGYVSTVSERKLLATGTVGKAASKAFFLWQDNMKAPRYENVIANPESIKWDMLEPDKLHIVLDTIRQNMTIDNFEQSLNVFEVAQAMHIPVAVPASLLKPLAKKAKIIFGQAELEIPKARMAKLMQLYGREVKEALA